MSAPAPGELKDLYERLYEKPYHAEWVGRCRAYDRQVALAQRLARGERILDIGCGEGVITRRLPGERVVGADFSTAALRRARAADGHGAYVAASADHLPFRAASFDCVCAFEVIEHLPEPIINPCLAEMARVCIPGGWIALSTPNLSSLWLALFRSLGFRNPEHLHEMDFVEVLNRLAPRFSVAEVHTNTEVPWLKTQVATEAASRIQARLTRIFPPLRHLLHTQVFILARNRPPSP
ncbi:MAG: methyltransferase domain-containing protein [Euryarchaeota archaeon]|nr:methyltransferase domain-containing protein [Euryarchaeota archaeon]